jgi:hypothetical protein
MGAGRGKTRRTHVAKLQAFPTDPLALSDGEEICALITQKADDGTRYIMAAGKTTIRVDQSQPPYVFYTPVWDLIMSFSNDQAIHNRFDTGEGAVCELYPDLMSCRAGLNEHVEKFGAQILPGGLITVGEDGQRIIEEQSHIDPKTLQKITF